jgi:hypothetical protein
LFDGGVGGEKGKIKKDRRCEAPKRLLHYHQTIERKQVPETKLIM